MNYLRLLRKIPFLTPKRRLELYPPFRRMGIKITALSDDWRHVRIRLPLNASSRNMGGSMFGGNQASLADPIAALCCARVIPGYSVWTRHMEIDFQREGNTDLELRFDFDPAIEEKIMADIERKGRSTPTFEYGYYLTDGTCCTVVKNTVAIRPRGYKHPKGKDNGAYY